MLNGFCSNPLVFTASAHFLTNEVRSQYFFLLALALKREDPNFGEFFPFGSIMGSGLSGVQVLKQSQEQMPTCWGEPREGHGGSPSGELPSLAERCRGQDPPSTSDTGAQPSAAPLVGASREVRAVGIIKCLPLKSNQF